MAQTAERRTVSYDHSYEVDEYGRVYKGGQTITQHRNTRGYDYCFLGDKCKVVSHIVAAAFCANPYNYTYVDHKDRNKQNNHYSNLRWCTSQHNNRNRGKRINKKGPPTTSKYKGVSWCKQKGKWRVRIMANKDTRKEIHLGFFDDEEEAAETYNIAAVKYFKEHAVINVL